MSERTDSETLGAVRVVLDAAGISWTLGPDDMRAWELLRQRDAAYVRLGSRAYGTDERRDALREAARRLLRPADQSASPEWKRAISEAQCRLLQMVDEVTP